MGCHRDWLCLCVPLESCKARYKPVEDSSRGGGLFSLVRSHLPRLASPAGSFFVRTCLLLVWACLACRYPVWGLCWVVCICYIKRPCHGLSKWQTNHGRVRACGILRGLVCVRGVGGGLDITGLQSLNEMLQKYLAVRGCARATPPPMHLLCKPDMFFCIFWLPIWFICKP
jgi:hypothetical protein